MAACQPVSLEPPVEYLDKTVKYCVYTYAIGDEETVIPVCSQYPLSKERVQRLDDQFNYSCFLYRKFAKARGLSVPNRTELELDVYLTTYEHINDVKHFPRSDEDLKIVGRYLNDRADLFVTDRMFTESGYVDFPHEVAHWFNDMLDITDKDRNEKLAREFERYYVNGTR